VSLLETQMRNNISPNLPILMGILQLIKCHLQHGLQLSSPNSTISFVKTKKYIYRRGILPLYNQWIQHTMDLKKENRKEGTERRLIYFLLNYNTLYPLPQTEHTQQQSSPSTLSACLAGQKTPVCPCRARPTNRPARPLREPDREACPWSMRSASRATSRT
jgi:hypothetical protein